MAGLYSDAPGPRFAYDRDGSTATVVNFSLGSVAYELSGADRVALNDETTSVLQNTGVSKDHTIALAVIFPELRDMLGYFVAQFDSGTGALEKSVDTTNGLDGSWVEISSAWVDNGPFDKEEARDAFTAITDAGVKALRFVGLPTGSQHRWQGLHLYGTIPAAQSPDRLRLWDPSADEPLDDNATDGPYFDWGDTPRSSSADNTFRVKNNSSTLTANSVTVAIESLTAAPTDSLESQHTFSTPSNPTFTATKALGNLSPGALSEVITVRRNLTATADLGLWWARITAEAASWA